MLKRYLMLLILVTSSLFSNEYEIIAEKFLQFKNQTKTIKSIEALKKDQTEVAYLFNLEGGGYILVPLSKSVSPVKSYSFHNNYDSLPPKVKKFIINELFNYISNRTLSKTINSNISDRWNFLETFTPTTNNRVLKSYIIDTNLLTTSWEQGYPYNKYFPKVNDESTLAGCVQVAFAQVMKYHAWPQKGKGIATHHADIRDQSDLLVRYDDMTAVLNRYYNWEIMADDKAVSEEYQDDEVAYLMRDLAVLNKASIGLADTSAVGNYQGLVEHFWYSNAISTMDSNDPTLIDTVKSQIDQELPVLFSLPGHMVVADGYSSDTTGEYIHLNMGWGLSSNTFYNVSENITAGGYIFSAFYDIIYNIKPCNEINGDCYKNLEEYDLIEGLNISGNFDTAKDIDEHQVFLSGTTTFSGDRGYSNQAFYINLFNRDNELIQSIAENETLELEADLYNVKISLCSADNYCYSNTDPNYLSYNVTITSQVISSEQQENIISTLSFPPEIDQVLSSKLITETEKILINGYDKNNEDNITFEAISNNENVILSFNKNILTLEPNTVSGHSKIKISVSSNQEKVEKEFDLFINDEKIYYGSEYTVKGQFDTQEEFELHEVVLDGVCVISGDNGYSNQAFYTSLLDINQNYITSMSDTTINSPLLSQDYYLLGASLKQDPTGYGSYYPYEALSSTYTLLVNCPDADNNITTLSNLLNIQIDNNPYEDESTDIYTNYIELKESWNLVSGNFDLTTLPDSIEVIWKYKNKNWEAYSDSLMDTIISMNIPLIQNINNFEGVWIKSSYDDNISINENNTTNIANFDTGWTLAGSGIDINVSQIACNEGTLNSIWKYNNNQWNLSTDFVNDLNLTSFDKIYANEGYWINCQ